MCAVYQAVEDGMGMPPLMYRWYFGADGVRGFERSMLSFAGIKPIRQSLYGLSFADAKKQARGLEDRADSPDRDATGQGMARSLKFMSEHFSHFPRLGERRPAGLASRRKPANRER